MLLPLVMDMVMVTRPLPLVSIDAIPDATAGEVTCVETARQACDPQVCDPEVVIQLGVGVGDHFGDR